MNKRDPLDVMWERVQASAPVILPHHDPIKHGFLVAELAKRWECDTQTAKRHVDALVDKDEWEATQVRYARSNRSRGTATAYKPKGGQS